MHILDAVQLRFHGSVFTDYRPGRRICNANEFGGISNASARPHERDQLDFLTQHRLILTLTHFLKDF